MNRLGRLGASVLLVSASMAGRALAEPTPETPSSRAEVAEALRGIEKRYGRDAVKLQSHLLNQALLGGSVLEASAGISGVATHDDRKYLIANLETGIIYDSSEVSAADCPARIWAEVVDPTLRQFETITVSADGFALSVAYRHGPYDDRSDLNEQLAAGALARHIVSFRLWSNDVLEMVHQRIASSELLRRSSAELDGRPVAIDLPAEPTPQPTFRDLFPTPEE